MGIFGRFFWGISLDKTQFVRKLGSVIHRWHECAYTFWKVRETGVHCREALAYNERVFFLEFRPALAGDNLTVYDIGAANGVLSSCLAKLYNVRAVHAFEPILSAFAELTERTRQDPKVIRHNVALGDENRTMDINVVGGSRDSSSLLKIKNLHREEFRYISCQNHLEKVNVVRLDDYVRDHHLPIPDVVKMDVQGYEDRVLCGGKNTISQAAYCILEISLVPLYESSPLFDDIYRKMRTMGFWLVGLGNPMRGESGRHLQLDGIFQNENSSALRH
jgi:FkbM family methyltransferase